MREELEVLKMFDTNTDVAIQFSRFNDEQNRPGEFTHGMLYVRYFQANSVQCCFEQPAADNGRGNKKRDFLKVLPQRIQPIRQGKVPFNTDGEVIIVKIIEAM